MKVEKSRKNRYGYIKGEINDYSWFALVHRKDVEYGIDPKTLKKGNGKITRLCVYKDIPISLENNVKYDGVIKRYIFANYKREWDVLSPDHKYIVKNLVEYLERRYSIKLVK
ncbi:hypothetical protein BET03_12005 [Thermohalobacter berrensis]|uniref:Uncharacterized protein n=1 Tax=Thermohalobacter berrensis TaxID=99594 RepID=A0A419T306_9FIRM|nr:hypothetical protein BET03_12005 [Thermohalobacter berrensis]